MDELESLKYDMKEIRQDQKLILKLLSPTHYTIGKVAEVTGRSRQAVKDWVVKNAEPNVGFFKKNGKILISEKVALDYINKRR